jgi:hypothetical protein
MPNDISPAAMRMLRDALAQPLATVAAEGAYSAVAHRWLVDMVNGRLEAVSAGKLGPPISHP